MTLLADLSAKRLCFTVTSGRSGTKLLATLLREAVGIHAEHEPAPRFNYVLRAVVDYPEAAKWWLLAEKLPAIAELARSHQSYAELSHLTCKGFIEPLIELGVRPCFLIISRPAREVATSLLKIGAIPERTGRGRLVLIGPQHSAFVPLKDWHGLSDYQLCYWYAREIEHRQNHYRSYFTARSIDWRTCTIADMTNWDRFRSLSRFVSGSITAEPDEATFEEILSFNQNPRSALLQGSTEANVPIDIDDEECAVERLIALSRGAPTW
jgi:hypothetical protein